MSFIVYRRPRSISFKDTKHAFERHYPKVTSSVQPAQPVLLIGFEDLPDWHQDNPAVRTGYRPISNSYSVCFRSCAQIHNETFNILTHMLPAIALVVSQYSVQQAITHYYPDASLADRLVFGMNVLAAITTFTLSTLYHTLMCHSQNVSTLWLRIDYMGILVLILGSFLSGIYVGFYCEPQLRNIYWSMITVFSTVTGTMVLHPSMSSPKFRSYKAYAFISTALTGLAPLTHGIYKYGWADMCVRSGMPYYLLEGVIYLLGAVFFITRFPESAWPTKFDIYFNSHSIFHTFVVAASLAHMYGVWSAYDWNYTHSRTCALSL